MLSFNREVSIGSAARWVGGVALSLLLTSCGGSAPSNANPVSKIADRAFVSNAQTQALRIVDAQTDTLSTFSITASGTPGKLLESANKATTLAYDSFDHGLDVIDNATETQSTTVTLPDTATSLAISPDGRFAYAAIPTAVCAVTPPTPAPPAGAVVVADLTAGSVTHCVQVPNAEFISLSHDGNALLAFAGGSNTAYEFNPTSPPAVAPSIPGSGSVLDNPVAAVFTSDDSSAFILSCGAECGGTTANVTAFSRSTKMLGGSVAGVSGAREGLLNGSTLYVAGTNGTNGVLQSIDTSTMKVSGTFPISDGVHDTIGLGSNGQLFVGARACSNTSQGCLSIFNTSSSAVVKLPANPTGDDITGIEPIPGRNVVYVCEGGELRIYSATSDALQPTQIDIVGNAVDVREVF
jgi:hypothetical protein